MNDVLTLVAPVYESDALNQRIPTGEEQLKEVFCSVDSVTRSEWYQAGHAGLKPEFRAVINWMDYEGQTIVIYQDVRYAVYRTYRVNRDTLELYLERKAGV